MDTAGEHRREVELAGRVAELERELAQTTARLRELDHRVKNDLQLITSLFVLQVRRAPEGPAKEAIRTALERINAVAAVHRRLQASEDAAHFDATGLVKDVVEEIAAAARGNEVELGHDLAAVTVPARQAAPLALIVNELVRNALKQAPPGQPGRLIAGIRSEGGFVILTLRDEGLGVVGEGFPQGFGATLVGLLAQQLRGTIEMRPDPPGATALVRFPQGS